MTSPDVDAAHRGGNAQLFIMKEGNLMKQNVGRVDRWVRIAVGVVLLSLLIFVSGPARWFGLIGLVPLITGILGYCPIYSLLKMRTNDPK